MARVVVDTNVYVSALNFGGAPDEVLALARIGAIDLFVSPPLLQEIEGILQRKFRWSATRAREAVSLIQRFATVVEPREAVNVVQRDEPDNRVLECALAADAAFIVTGDRDLLDLERFGDVRIVTPRQFLEAGA